MPRAWLLSFLCHLHTTHQYNIFDDPYEYTNLASDPAHSDTLKSMQAKLADANTRFFDPVRGGNKDGLACKVAKEKYGGYYGPFLD